MSRILGLSVRDALGRRRFISSFAVDRVACTDIAAGETNIV